MHARTCHSLALFTTTALLAVPSLDAADKTQAAVPRKSTAKPEAVAYPTIGSIERLDPALDPLIPPDARIEKLAEGFDWSEGPVWLPAEKCLLFSDVPRNVVHRWAEGEGVSEYLRPSGYTGSRSRGGEPGSNGLTLDAQGRLVLCQHGDRRVSIRDQKGKLTPLAVYYNFRHFNSPNDLVFKSNGDLYFTDPPYGLEGNVNDPNKELPYCGVFRVAPDGVVTLLADDLSFPNGIAFSPDEKTLYVAISDPKWPVIVAFEVRANGLLGRKRVFFDAAPLTKGRKGLPDGMKVDVHGNVWSTGPGGVLVISPEGRHLGTIQTGEATANCAWGGDGSVLYITADMYLCRVRTTTRGKGF